MHLNTNIAPIDSATATGAAWIGFVIQVAHPTPMTADTILPPMIDQGWASGLAGTANNNTADAPIGATSSGMSAVSPRKRCITPAVTNMPKSAPRQDLNRSGQASATGEGEKLRSQRVRADRTMGLEDSVSGRGPLERPRHQAASPAERIVKVCDYDIY